MKNSELNLFLGKLKRNIKYFQEYGELVKEPETDDANSQDAIKSIQNVVARMRSNLSITESRNASFFFDLEDLS